MSAARFRRFSQDDLRAVVNVFRSNVPKYFVPEEELELRNFLSPGPDDYFVLVVDNEIVGSGGIASNRDHTVSLCWGMIRADRLGTGLGRELTEFRIDLARKRFGNCPLVISTSQHTEEFYKKFGFATTHRKPNGFGLGIDTCLMRRER